MPDFEGDLRFYLGLASLGTMAILSFLVVFLSARGIRRSWVQAVRDSREFPDREPLTLDQFYEFYYAAEQLPRTAVLDTVTRFAAAAHVPVQFLKPVDSFQTIGAIRSDDCERFITDAALVLHEAEERYGVSLFSGKLVTLDDFIRVHALAARLASRSAAKTAKA